MRSDASALNTKGAVEPPCRCGQVGPIVTINSVPIHALTPESALSRIEQMLDCPATHVVNHIPADPVVIARRDTSFRESLQRADLNLPDGMGVVWAARLLGVEDLRKRVYGPDFMLDVMAWGVERGVRHAFVGGSPSTLERLIDNLRLRVPSIEIAAAHSPPIRPVSPRGVEEDLSRLDVEADIIWVGLGTPKQQLWADYARRAGSARVISSVGAAFDFLGGMKPQAPSWMQRAGLEWLFRLSTEPRRLWHRYLVGNPKFLWYTVGESSRRLKRVRRDKATQSKSEI